MKIYLSPSNQPHNKYVVGNTNEKEQMEFVAKLVAQELNNYDCTYKMATLSYPISLRYDEAKDCDVYLAIHSNAGSPTARGTVAFYHPDSGQSKKLANNLIQSLNSISVHGSNRYSQLQNGMTGYMGSKPFGEINQPFKRHRIPPVLLEVDYHDNPNTARWIIDNKVQIAKAIVEALVKTFDIKKRSHTSDHNTNKLYYVQIGAFGIKENAERLAKKAKDKGFDVYIKEG